MFSNFANVDPWDFAGWIISFSEMEEFSPSRPSLTSHKRGVFHAHFLPDCVFTWLREGELRGERAPSDVSPQLQGHVFVYILANWRATSPSAPTPPAAAVMETMARSLSTRKINSEAPGDGKYLLSSLARSTSISRSCQQLHTRFHLY